MDCPGVDKDSFKVLEERAQLANTQLERTIETDRGDQFHEAKEAAVNLLNDALAMTPEKQSCLLKLAEQSNERWRRDEPNHPGINAVFSHSLGTLAKFQLSYPHLRASGPVSSFLNYYAPGYETVDLYSP